MVPPVSADPGPRKKHRHDLGQEDHGPVMAARTTRGIQMLLGLWIGLTGLALVWAMVVAGDGAGHMGPDATGAAPTVSEPATR
jgi:hypothetical protein